MATRKGVKNLFFNVDIMLEDEKGRRLGKLKPDKEGFYTCPIAVLGKGALSRNLRNYNPESIVRCINDPKSKFFRSLREGNLAGEYGHPEDRSLKRAMHIDQNNVSHFFRSIKADESTLTEKGNLIIEGKFKPFGPKKQYLLESIEEEYYNTSFSLRAISQKGRTVNKIPEMIMRLLVTFDNVLMGGFKEASKRYSVTSECFEVPFGEKEIRELKDSNEVVYEDYSYFFEDQELLDKMESDSVVMRSRHTGFVDEENVYRKDNGRRGSMVCDLFGNRY